MLLYYLYRYLTIRMFKIIKVVSFKNVVALKCLYYMTKTDVATTNDQIFIIKFSK